MDYSNHVYKNGMLFGEKIDTDAIFRQNGHRYNRGWMQYATDYEIVFDNTIESVTGEKCKDSYIFKFTTEDNPDAVYWQRLLMQAGAVIRI